MPKNFCLSRFRICDNLFSINEIFTGQTMKKRIARKIRSQTKGVNNLVMLVMEGRGGDSLVTQW